MPLLVRKKLVSADCACAGALAIADMAATAKHAGRMIRTKLFIEVLPVVFLVRCHQHAEAAIIPVP
jgi:methyl coenzyme M reductase alpha subunit